MAEYIERDKAVESIKELMGTMPAKDNYAKGYDAAIGRVLIAVRQVLAADVQPVEHSKWICVNEDENVYMCDKCGGEVIFIEGNPTNNEYIYCMYCGAKMDMPEAIKG